jgi:hypothetical protein
MLKEVKLMMNSNKRSEITKKQLPLLLKPEDFLKKTLNNTDLSYKRDLNSLLTRMLSISSKSIYMKVQEEFPNSSTRKVLPKSSRS